MPGMSFLYASRTRQIDYVLPGAGLYRHLLRFGERRGTRFHRHPPGSGEHPPGWHPCQYLCNAEQVELGDIIDRERQLVEGERPQEERRTTDRGIPHNMRGQDSEEQVAVSYILGK